MVWYKFDNDIVNMLIDSSSDKYNLTNNGATHSTSVYKVGYGSAQFDGTSLQYLTMDDRIDISKTASVSGITFTSWFKMSKSSGINAKLMEFGDKTNPDNWVTISTSDTENVYTIYFEVGIDGVSTKHQTTQPYMDDKWHHLSWSISHKGEWSIFIDSQFVSHDIEKCHIPDVTWSYRYIGKSGITGHKYFTGYVEDFRIYDKVLTSYDVEYLYNYSSLSMPTLEEYPPVGFSSVNSDGSHTIQTGTFNVSKLLYGNGEYNISSSSSHASYSVMNIFDKVAGNYWRSLDSYQNIDGSYSDATNIKTPIKYNEGEIVYYLGEWFQIKLPQAIVVNRYGICSVNTSSINDSLYAPKHFVLVGSNDGIEWTIINSQMNVTNWGISSAEKVFSVQNNITKYSYYRLCIGAIQGNHSSYISAGISSWKLFGNKTFAYPLVKIEDNTFDTYTNKNVYYWNGDTSIGYDDVMLRYENGDNIQSLLSTFHEKRAFSIHMVINTKDNSKKSQIFYIGNLLNGSLISIYIDGQTQRLVFKVGDKISSAAIVNNTNYVVQFVFSYTIDNDAKESINMKIYLNNKLSALEDYNTYNNLFLNVDKDELVLYIGESSPIYLRDLRIFSSILSQFEISSLQSGNTVYTYSPNIINEIYQYKRWNDSDSYFNSTNDEKYITYTDGNVGIGVNDPGIYKLNIGGDSYINGDMILTGEMITSYSDERLKTRTGTIENPLEIINSITSFKYKSNDLAKEYGYNDVRTHIGVSAQDVQKVLPEIVTLAPFDASKDINGNYASKSGDNYLSVQYDRIVPVLIEAIKELVKKNNENKVEIELLKTKIN
jgi:hypothetical protein